MKKVETMKLKFLLLAMAAAVVADVIGAENDLVKNYRTFTQERVLKRTFTHRWKHRPQGLQVDGVFTRPVEDALRDRRVEGVQAGRLTTRTPNLRSLRSRRWLQKKVKLLEDRRRRWETGPGSSA